MDFCVDLTYEERCEKEKQFLEIPQEFKYDLETGMVTMPYSSYKDLTIMAQQAKHAMDKENKVLIKMIIKIYLRLVLILQLLSAMGSLVFLIKGPTLFAFIFGLIFCLTFILPKDKDDLHTLFLERIRNYSL